MGFNAFEDIEHGRLEIGPSRPLPPHPFFTRFLELNNELRPWILPDVRFR